MYVHVTPHINNISLQGFPAGTSWCDVQQCLQLQYKGNDDGYNVLPPGRLKHYRVAFQSV